MTDGGLPTRFHIGCPRSGSTYLFNLLRGHPEVSLSPAQIVNFYHRHYDKGVEWYLAQFPDEGIRIDTSPKYFRSGSVVAPRILDMVGADDPRFVLVLRNPIDYLRSHWQMHRRRDFFRQRPDVYPHPDLDFPDFLEAHPRYRRRAQYHALLNEHWLSRFSRDQFHLLTFEQLTGEPEPSIKGVCRFYGIQERYVEPPTSARNATLRWPVFRRLQKRVVQRPALRRVLRSSRAFNWTYRHVLSGPTDPLEPVDRPRVARLLEDDVRELAGLGVETARWPDFQ